MKMAELVRQLVSEYEGVKKHYMDLTPREGLGLHLSCGGVEHVLFELVDDECWEDLSFFKGLLEGCSDWAESKEQEALAYYEREYRSPDSK